MNIHNFVIVIFTAFWYYIVAYYAHKYRINIEA